LTPDDFLFDVKAFRDLTHSGMMPADRTFLEFRESLAPLRAANRFGCALFQFPPTFSNDNRNQALLRRIASEMADYPVAVEFRHGTRLDADPAPARLALLSELGLTDAIADEPQLAFGTVPPLVAVTNPSLAYLRLHGRNAAGGSGHR